MTNVAFDATTNYTEFAAAAAAPKEARAAGSNCSANPIIII